MQHIKNVLKWLGIIFVIIMILEVSSFLLPTNNIGFSLRKNLSDKHKLELDYSKLSIALLPTPHLIVNDLTLKYRNNPIIKAEHSEFFLKKTIFFKIFSNSRTSLQDIAEVGFTKADINWDLAKKFLKASSDLILIRGLFLSGCSFTINNSRVINEYGEKIATLKFITFNESNNELNGEFDYRHIAHQIQLHIPANTPRSTMENVKLALKTSAFDLTLDAKRTPNLHKFLATANKTRKPNLVFTVKDNSALAHDFIAYLQEKNSSEQANLDSEIMIANQKSAAPAPTAPSSKAPSSANQYHLEANFDFDPEDFHLSNIKYIYGNVVNPIQGFVKLNSTKEQNYLLAKIYAQSVNLSFLNNDANGVDLFKLITFAQNFVTRNIANTADDENSPDFDILTPAANKTTLSNIVISFPEIIVDSLRHSLFASAMFYNDKIIIDELLLKLNADTTISFYGNYRETKDLPGLSGIINLNSSKAQDIAHFIGIPYKISENANASSLKLQSIFEINPNLIKLRNGVMQINDKTTTFSTQIWSKSPLEDQDTPLSWDLNLQTDELNLDSWKAAVYLDNYLAQLYLADQEKKNEAFYDYSNNFFWLRRFPTEFNINLNAKNLIFRNNNLNDAILQARIAPNIVEIEQLDFNLDKSRIWSKGKFSLQFLEPNVEFTTQFAKLTWDSLNKILPDYSAIKSQALAQRDKPAVPTTQIKSGNIFFPNEKAKTETEEFNFFSLPYINLKGQIIFSAAEFGDFTATNGKLAFKANNGVVQADEIYCETLGGLLSAQAYAEIYSAMPKFSLAFSLADINPDKVFAYFTHAKDKIYGYLSLKGDMTGYGNNWGNLLLRNSGTIDLSGRRVVWNGFAINKAIEDIENGELARETKKTNINNYLNSGQTIFDELSGKITLTNGLASLSDFAFTNSRLAGSFAANYNLLSREFISLANFEFMPLNQDQALSIELNSKGTLPDKVQNDFTKNVLERYLNNLYPNQDDAAPKYDDIR